MLLPTLGLGCDRDEDTDEPRNGEQAAAHERHPHGGPIEKLCAAVECSDTQRETLTGLLAAAPHQRPSEETFDTANAALADAWRDADFDTGDLADWRDAVHGDEDGPKLSAETIVAVHGVLDARQRGVLADLLEERGPGLFFGPRGKGGHGKGKGKAGGKGGKRPGGTRDGKGPDKEAFAAHAADALCERVSCTTEQRATIVAAIGEAAPRRGDEAGDAAFAAAFRADTLAVTQVQTYLDGIKARHDAERTERDAKIVTIHHVLTAEQRATIATSIAEHGPHALMPRGKRGHHDRTARG